MPKVTLVIPVFNCAESIYELTQRIVQVSRQSVDVSSVIFVDDGSTDDSWKQLLKVRHEFGNVVIKIIRLSRNFGQHNASLCGIRHADSEYVVTLDADLQHPPEAIPELVRFMGSADMDLVYGTARKGHSLKRRFLGKLFNVIGNIINRNRVSGSGFRIFNQMIACEISRNRSPFLFLDQEFLSYTSRISSVNVSHEKRRHGQSAYSFSRLAGMVLDILTNYFSFFFIIVILVGILLFFIGVTAFTLNALGYTVLYFSGSAAISFMEACSFSILFISIGLAGITLNKITMMTSGKPQYVVRESLDNQ